MFKDRLGLVVSYPKTGMKDQRYDVIVDIVRPSKVLDSFC